MRSNASEGPYNLHEGVVFTSHRLSRCDPKVSDFFMIMRAADVSLLRTQPDASCEYPPGAQPWTHTAPCFSRRCQCAIAHHA